MPVSLAELVNQGITTARVKAYDEDSKKFVAAVAKEIRIEKYIDKLKVITMEDGVSMRCTDTHLIMDADGEYIPADNIREGQQLSGGHTVTHVSIITLPEKVPVYDMTVPKYLNFVLENGLIVHNSGKSFSAKREIFNVFLVTTDDIIICDPESEYGAIVRRLGGQVIRISPTSTDFINPMDLNLNYSDDENPLSLKSDFILSLCELIVGGKDGLQPVEKTIIDRCVRLVYRDYLNDPRPRICLSWRTCITSCGIRTKRRRSTSPPLWKSTSQARSTSLTTVPASISPTALSASILKNLANS
jgi:hypothetical protein